MLEAPAFIEVEVDSLAQFDALLTLPPKTIDIVLLDNMGPELLAEAVARRDRASPGLLLEASGGITLETIAAIAPNDSQARFEGLGVTVIRARAKFVGPRTVEAGGQRYEARKWAIATSSRAAIPPIPGLAELAPLTNETVFELDRAPAHLVVIGGGPIGCELAQAHARLGTVKSAFARMRSGPLAAAMPSVATRQNTTSRSASWAPYRLPA